MKLYLYGHDYKYAAEQMLLTLFPAQRPEYPAGPPAPGEDALVLSLHRGAVWATATAALSYGGREYRAARRCRTAELTDPLSTDRALQRILKLAFYDAGTAARGGEPPWGALTGVRPVKIPTKAMLAGAGPAQAERLLRDTYRVTEGRRRLAMDCAGASLAALRSLAPGEVSLYVGIPFCPTRCAYCSFVSADVGRALKLIDPFLDALCRELAATGAMLAAAGAAPPPPSPPPSSTGSWGSWRTTSTCRAAPSTRWRPGGRTPSRRRSWRYWPAGGARGCR